jgi:hypothetical protein
VVQHLQIKKRNVAHKQKQRQKLLITSIDAEKVNKIQHHFIIKGLRKSSLPAAAAAARLCLRLSDKSADWVGGAVITGGAGHGGALRLHQVPPALPLRGAISGAAAVQGARARAATGNWGRWRRGPELPVLRGRPAGSLGQGVADPPS